MNKIKNSYTLAKISFGVLRSEKRILLAQVVFLSTLLTIIGILGYIFYNPGQFEKAVAGNFEFSDLSYLPIILAVIFIMALAYFLLDAVIAKLALAKIRKEEVATGEIIGLVTSKFRPIFEFTLLSSTIGGILRFADDYLPPYLNFGTYIASGAWNLASAFAIVNIVDGKVTTGIGATKKSVQDFTNAFGENIVVRVSVGIIMLLISLLWMLGGAIVTILLFSNDLTQASGVTALATIFGLIFILLINTAMESILKVMLYEYVTNGKETDVMEKNLFQQMINAKKARQVFSS